MSDPQPTTQPRRPQYYHYDPSLAGNAIFIALFAIPTMAHIVMMFRRRTWYFIPFIIGCLFETTGYAARTYNTTETPNWSFAPFVVQILAILLAPAFSAASIYMILGRLVRLLGAEHHSLVRPSWLTKIFVGGDVLSFLTQCAGGGMLANADTKAEQDLAKAVALAGLGIQVAFFGVFMITTLVFHVRIQREPTSRSLSVMTPWPQLILALYFSSICIFVRSIYRMVEFGMGPTGALWKHEVFLFVLDGVLMFIVVVVFLWQHPGTVLIGYKDVSDSSRENLESRQEDYPMEQAQKKGDHHHRRQRSRDHRRRSADHRRHSSDRRSRDGSRRHYGEA